MTADGDKIRFCELSESLLFLVGIVIEREHSEIRTEYLERQNAAQVVPQFRVHGCCQHVAPIDNAHQFLV
jgi:hypothetical protein